MDMFGIGAAVRSLFEVHSLMSRNTGRSRKLEHAIQDGGIVIVLVSEDGLRMQRSCRAMGKEITYVTLSMIDKGSYRPSSDKQVLLCHRVIEKMYKRSLDSTAKVISTMEQVEHNPDKTYLTEAYFVKPKGWGM